MRLIDADNLVFNGRQYNNSQMKAILDFVDAQPTAYDPDKVVEQLEDMKSTYRRLRDLKDKDYLKYRYIIETLIDAIEIVKDDGGG
jgi:hypothetical protein